MRRHRRLVITERAIPFLAAFVGLLALAGAVLVEVSGQQRTELLSEELARLQQSLDLLSQRADAAAASVADAEAGQELMELGARMDRLEQAWASQPATVAAATPASEDVDTVAAAERAIDPNLPSTDCIPAGTRFMGVSGESYPICQSPAVVRVSAVTGDTVVVEGAGVITESTSAELAGTDCALTVFSAEIEGFAEMRVTCR